MQWTDNGERRILDGVRPILGLLQEAAGHGKHLFVVLADDALKRLRVACTEASQKSGFLVHRGSLSLWSRAPDATGAAAFSAAAPACLHLLGRLCEPGESRARAHRT